MTPSETTEFEKKLEARGWRYDADKEQFLDGSRVLDQEILINLLPNRAITLAEVAAYKRERFSLRATKY